jgi:hypothetical protein
MTQKLKYPRTPHLPFSLGATSDDKRLEDCGHFIGQQVVVTEKMDGENSTLAKDYYHARSLDSKNHPSRHWIKTFHARFAHEIPEGMRICGENLYATHSIHYDSLPSYFLAFSIWREQTCFCWQETRDWCNLLGIDMVPVLYEGIWDEALVRGLYKAGTEGYVVRIAGAFDYNEFEYKVAKYVRAGHVQTDDHWMTKEVVPNGIKSSCG